MPTADDLKEKKIEVDITNKEVEMEGGQVAIIYNVQIRSDSGVWDQIATSKENLEAVIRGINMGLGMIGVHGGIPTSVSVPFSKEIICYKGHVCKDFD